MTTDKRERFKKMNQARKGKTIEELFGKETAERMRASWKISRPMGEKSPRWAGRIKVECPCGKVVLKSPSLAGKYCSRKCYHNYSMDRAKLRTKPSFHHLARKLALSNFSNKCSFCGSTKNLQVHHIDRNYKNNSLENLLILCCKCHQTKVHQSIGERRKIR